MTQTWTSSVNVLVGNSNVGETTVYQFADLGKTTVMTAELGEDAGEIVGIQNADIDGWTISGLSLVSSQGGNNGLDVNSVLTVTLSPSSGGALGVSQVIADIIASGPSPPWANAFVPPGITAGSPNVNLSVLLAQQDGNVYQAWIGAYLFDIYLAPSVPLLGSVSGVIPTIGSSTGTLLFNPQLKVYLFSPNQIGSVPYSYWIWAHVEFQTLAGYGDSWGTNIAKNGFIVYKNGGLYATPPPGGGGGGPPSLPPGVFPTMCGVGPGRGTLAGCGGKGG